MVKKDLAKAVSGVTGFTVRDSVKIIEAVFNKIEEAVVYSDKLFIRGFGTFYLKKFKGKTGRIVKTGVSVKFDDYHKVVIKMSKRLKHKILDVKRLK